MAETCAHFDSMVVGNGYASVPTPTTDADPNKISSTQHCLDSTNAAMQIQVVSIPTTAKDGPTNPAPYWNSGNGPTQTTLE